MARNTSTDEHTAARPGVETLYVHINVSLAERLRSFIKGAKPHPTKRGVIEDALEQYLNARETIE